MVPDSKSKDPRPAGDLDRRTLVVTMRILLLVREESGLAKRIRSFWSAIYWVRIDGTVAHLHSALFISIPYFLIILDYDFKQTTYK